MPVLVPTELTELMLAEMPEDQPHTVIRADGAGHSRIIDTPEVFGDAVLDCVDRL